MQFGVRSRPDERIELSALVSVDLWSECNASQKQLDSSGILAQTRERCHSIFQGSGVMLLLLVLTQPKQRKGVRLATNKA